MKRALKNILRAVGLDVRRIKKVAADSRSSRTSHLTLYDTKTGKYYLPTDARADIIANAIKKGRIFEEEVVKLALEQIRPGTVVLDVGSNFGQMAVLFASAAGPQGKVYAFDADDFVFDILKKNIAANGLSDRVVPTFGAVHNIVGDVLYFPEQDFKRFGSYGSYGIDYKGKKGREVPTLTIDSLDIQEHISFMKVDVQGGDLLAMKGASKTIEKNRMPILFEYEYHFEEELGLCFQDYVDFVHEIGYKFSKVINGHNYLIVPR